MKDYSLLKILMAVAILTLGLMSCKKTSDSNLIAPPDRTSDSSGQEYDTDYPAQPEPGSLFWGSSIEGNGDPVVRHEDPAGEVLSLRRTFWRWDQRTGNMINFVQDDLENGRLPWISVKPPPCQDGDSDCETWQWLAMANGEFDDEIDEMLKKLAILSGPVWLTIHHEPEGGGGSTQPNDLVGGIEAHIGMNKRVRERMVALEVENVALVPIFMAWTWDKRSERSPDDWWEDDIYDFLGIDIYHDKEDGSLLTTGQAIDGGPVWSEIRLWAEERGVDIAVGEWGMRGTDEAAGERVLEWYEHGANSHDDGEGARVVGLSAFDSGLNSPSGSWELQGAQLEMFRQLLGDPRTASIMDFQ